MSVETLLEAAKYLEKSMKGTSKDDTAIPRANQSAAFLADRRRVVSESDHERRRRPGGAGTRETHNKLEKNRRAHLKECFDSLKKQVPSLEEKKTSNLNILRGALKYIQNLKKREIEQNAEKDLLTISNNMIKEKLEGMRKDIQGAVDVQTSQSSVVAGPDKSIVSNSEASKVHIAVTRISPVSVATQTSFNAAESEAVSSSETSDRDDSEGSNGQEAEAEKKEPNGLERERKNGWQVNEKDDESEEIDVENDDDESEEERKSIENAQKDEVKEEKKSTGKSEEVNGELKNGEAKEEKEKNKIPNGTRKCPVTREANRKRSRPRCEADEEEEEEKNAKIKGCARVSC